jgi:hypothetical protein
MHIRFTSQTSSLELLTSRAKKVFLLVFLTSRAELARGPALGVVDDEGIYVAGS